MVTTARRAAKPVSLVSLMLFALGPGFVLAGPQSTAEADVATASTADAASSDATSTPIAASWRSLATHSWTSPADVTPGPGSRSLDNPPLWIDTTATDTTPDKTGSWWSRRTTAQKTWFIVGIVAGAAGIYAIASHHSGGGGSGGSGY
jgi:hypothetical protein